MQFGISFVFHKVIAALWPRHRGKPRPCLWKKAEPKDSITYQKRNVMNCKKIITSAALAALCMYGTAQSGKTESSETPQLGIDPIDKVIGAMTLEEKLDLLIGSEGNEQTDAKVTVGNSSTLVPGAAGQLNAIPRLGIPSTVLADGAAGLRIDPTRKGTDSTFYCTHFPISTVMSATWNTGLVAQVGKALGSEVKHYGVDVLLAPSTNIQRNPLNGRNYEYYSEDPLLSGKMCAAMIGGVQSNGVGTCLKHFALNNQETNRSGNNVIGSPRTFREIYLKPFEMAVKEAKPWTVMTSYNRINGTMASERCDLITEILRHEWGFDGMVMTDWLGGENAVAQMEAGNDLLMPGQRSQREAIKKAVLNGRLSLEIIDRNVKHVLEYILKTPRFDGYQADNAPDLAANAAVTRRAALEGMVLLKNAKSVLPLDTMKIKNVALFGRTSYDFIAGGSGSGDVNHAYVVSLLDGLKRAGFAVDETVRNAYESYIPEQKKLLPVPTGPLAALLPKPLVPEMALDNNMLERSAEANDIAIVTVGKISGEFADRKITGDFYLTDAEQQMIGKVSDAFHHAGKKVVVILNVCGVTEVKSWTDKADAVLVAWLPGQEGGNSVADLLIGNESPSARLPMTWPLTYDDVPSKDNFPNTDEISDDLLTSSMTADGGNRQKEPLKNFDYTDYKDGIYVGYRYYSTQHVPVAYPFGYGLSYTTFKYGKPQVGIGENGNIKVSVEVKNAGRRAGKEVVQVYVSAPGKDMDKPERELKAFAKTRSLAPGESQVVTLEIACRDLASFNEAASQWQVEEGDYKILIAKNAADTKPLVGTVHVEGTVVAKVRPCLLEEQK